MATNAERRDAYKFYRSLGFSRKEAMNRRNRPLKKWDDYFSRKTEVRDHNVKQFRQGHHKNYKKLPVTPEHMSKKQLLKIRADLVEVGFSKKAAYNLTRTPKKAANAMYSTLRLNTRMDKASRIKAIKKRQEAFKKQIALLEKQSDIYNLIQESYIKIVTF